MGILRAMAIRRRVKEMQEYARVLSVATAELRYRRDILAQVFVRVAKKCRQPYAAWLSELSQALMEAQQRQAYSYTEVAADFDQIWIEHADKLYESSCLKQEDMEYIYNLGQTIGYLDVQAQEEGLALLQADLGRHIRELEAEAKDRMRLSLVVGSVAGVLLIIILISRCRGMEMTIQLIFKIAAVGIVVALINQVLKHSGRDDQAYLVSLAGLIIVLTWIIPYVNQLFQDINTLFGF